MIKHRIPGQTDSLACEEGKTSWQHWCCLLLCVPSLFFRSFNKSVTRCSWSADCRAGESRTCMGWAVLRERRGAQPGRHSPSRGSGQGQQQKVLAALSARELQRSLESCEEVDGLCAQRWGVPESAARGTVLLWRCWPELSRTRPFHFYPAFAWLWNTHELKMAVGCAWQRYGSVGSSARGGRCPSRP